MSNFKDKIERYFKECRDGLLYEIRSFFNNGRTQIFGNGPQDILQEGFIKFFKNVKEKKEQMNQEDFEEWVDNKLTKGYVFNSIKTNARRYYINLSKNYQVNEKHKEDISKKYYNEEDMKEVFDEIDLENDMDNLSQAFTCFRRILQEESNKYEAAKEKLGVRSARQFYKMKDIMKKKIKEMGYGS